MGIMKQRQIEQWDKEDREQCSICERTGSYKRDDFGRFDTGGGVSLHRCIVCGSTACDYCIDDDDICQMCTDRIMND